MYITAVPIENVYIDVLTVNDERLVMELEAPNSQGDDLFVYGFQPIGIFDNYRDDNLWLQDGERYFEFFCSFSYESHSMDTRRLMTAKKITIRVPPEFGDVEKYQEFDVLFEGDSQRSFFNGLAMGGEGLEIPNGADTFQFTGINPYKWDEMLAVSKWNQSFSPIPENLLVNVSVNTANFSWNATEGDGYNLYLSLDGAEFIKQNSNLIQVEQFSLDGMVNGDYKVYVTTLKDGLESKPSDKVSFTVLVENSIFYISSNEIYKKSITTGITTQLTSDGISKIDIDVDIVNGKIVTTSFVSDIMRMYNLDGSGGVTINTSNLVNGGAFDIPNQKIYYSIAQDYVYKSNYDGSSPQEVFDDVFFENPHVNRVDSADSKLVHASDDTLYIVDLITGSVTDLVLGNNNIDATEVDREGNRIVYTIGTVFHRIDYDGNNDIVIGDSLGSIAINRNNSSGFLCYSSGTGVLTLYSWDGIKIKDIDTILGIRERIGVASAVYVQG